MVAAAVVVVALAVAVPVVAVEWHVLQASQTCSASNCSRRAMH